MRCVSVRNRWICGFCAVAMVLSLFGCYDYREINDTVLVAGIAVDAGEKSRYAVTAEIVTPEGGDTPSHSCELLTREGETVEICLKSMIFEANRQLQFSHCQLVIFSEQIARQGIGDTVDYFLRDPEFRPDLHLAVFIGGNAKELFEADRDGIWAQDHLSVIRNITKESGTTPDRRMYEFQMDRRSLLPVWERVENDTFDVNGSAGFRDGKMCCRLDREMTQSVLIVTGEFLRGETVLRAEDGEPVLCQIRSAKTKRSVGEDLSMAVSVSCAVNLISIPGNMDLSDAKGMRDAEEKLTRYLSGRIASDRERCDETQAEFWGAEEYLFRHVPDKTDQWRRDGKNFTSDLSVSFDARVRIENFGYSEERTAR